MVLGRILRNINSSTGVTCIPHDIKYIGGCSSEPMDFRDVKLGSIPPWDIFICERDRGNFLRHRGKIEWTDIGWVQDSFS